MRNNCSSAFTARRCTPGSWPQPPQHHSKHSVTARSSSFRASSDPETASTSAAHIHDANPPASTCLPPKSARRRTLLPQHQPQQRALAAARLTQHNNKLALFNLQDSIFSSRTVFRPQRIRHRNTKSKSSLPAQRILYRSHRARVACPQSVQASSYHRRTC